MENFKPKIVFLGTSEFGAIILQELVEKGYEPVLVVTTPDKPGIILKEKEEWLKTCKNYSKKSLKSFAFRFPYLFLNVYSYEDAMIFLE